MNKTPNNSIRCSVNRCAYHCGEQNYCTLNEIKVGCCDANVTNCANTECASFQLGTPPPRGHPPIPPRTPRQNAPLPTPPPAF